MKIRDKEDGEIISLPDCGQRYFGINNILKQYTLKYENNKIVLHVESNVGGIQRWLAEDVTDQFEIVKE